MMLPKLVGQTIISAGNTGQKFSWKVKESEKERLIQLVWKAELEIPTILAAQISPGDHFWARPIFV